MATQITAFVGPDHDLVHTSLLLTGLAALHKAGVISFRMQRPGAAEQWLVGDPIVVCLDVRANGVARIAVDLRDGEGLSRPIIDRVQWYVKRSYYTAEVDSLPTEIGAKVLPFGLNYPCRSTAATVRTMMTVGGAIGARGRPGIGRLRQYLGIPQPHTFEQPPETPVEPLITFQTRVWAPNEVPAAELDELNSGRVAVIRALREAFGDRFVGGLVPTAFARAHYPNDLTPHPTRHAEYHALRKRCLVGVYTHGLEHSLAFKLGETIAAAQCLVSEPLRYGLPVPLEADVHYLLFETADQCVAACRRLLSDSELARRMRRANHDYYRQEVEPAAHVQRMLERLGQLAATGAVKSSTAT